MYDFGTLDRTGTGSMKWDVAEGELPMWVADMDLPTAPAVRLALQKRARHGAYGYTVVPDSWYDAIINWWSRRHGFSIRREWLQFCTGVVPAISCLVKRFTNPGDDVVVLTPVYDIFFHSIENAGRHVLECPLAYDGTYHLDFALLEEALSRPLSTLLILCNPHNPTGNVWTREELSRIGALCKQYGVTVISDEIHCDLTLPGVFYTPFASASEICASISVTCISASKAFNLAGLQGAAAVIPDPALRHNAVRGLNSDELAEPNCFVTEATVAAFNEGEAWLEALREHLARNRAIAAGEIGKIEGLYAVPGQATYLLWVECGSPFGKDFGGYLREKTGLVLSDGQQYRGNGSRFVRINLGCSEEILREGLRRLAYGAQLFRTESE